MRVNKSVVTLILFGLFLLESTLLQWMIPSAWQGQVKVVPHLVLIGVIFTGLYLHRYTAMLYGLFFGLVHDIVHYGPMIGPYCFIFGAIGYLSGSAGNRLYPNMMNGIFIVAAGNFLFEWFIYAIYHLFRVTHDRIEHVFPYIMLPSILINLLFALLMYVPARRLLERVQASSARDES
jgi:rod shape-determining protein MreD